MISVNDLRGGTLFEQQGSIYQVIKFERHKMARSKGMVNVTARDVRQGGVKEFNFRSGENVPEVDVTHKRFTYVYADDRKGEVTILDPETKKRETIALEKIGEEQVKYLSEGAELTVLVGDENDEIFSIQIPKTVELKVVNAPPGDKGDTASGGTMGVEVETGITVQTPFFIKNGDVIKVNTESGDYIERV